MGGALWLAILASLAASRIETLAAEGGDPLAALTGGSQAPTGWGSDPQDFADRVD